VQSVVHAMPAQLYRCTVLAFFKPTFVWQETGGIASDLLSYNDDVLKAEPVLRTLRRKLDTSKAASPSELGSCFNITDVLNVVHDARKFSNFNGRLMTRSSELADKLRSASTWYGGIMTVGFLG